ncbi:MAG: hypothetical protein ACKVQU_29565 [Burkholderiales bacterium]
MRLRVVFAFATHARGDEIVRDRVEAHVLWVGGRAVPIADADLQALIDHNETIARRWRANRQADRRSMFGADAKKWIA